MPSTSSLLVASSAAVILLLGVLHLTVTFRGTKLHPRDPAVLHAMQAASPRISRETTMWRTWIGINASHSFGAILFGLVYGYLALLEPTLFFGISFLQAVGLAFLAGYVFLGKRYWFSVPFRGIVVATVLYVLALVVSRGGA